MPGIHLRTRVLRLTGAFALALAAITFGLTWQAKQAQERWTLLLRVETGAVSLLDELIHAQNGYRVRLVPGDPQAPSRYTAVKQLLEMDPLNKVDTSALRVRINAYETLLRAGAPSDELDAESARIVTEAGRLKEQHQTEIARQLPFLETESDNMMATGFGVAWIVAMVAFAVAAITNRKVVRPLESLAAAANRIAAGDLSQRAPIGGDYESAELARAFNQMAATLQKNAAQLEERARTDDLTGLPNFRAFRERIDAEIERASRYSESFGVLVLDLDRFKAYNDSCGHQAGNEALQRVAGAIRESVRAADFPARYGGEEFAVIAPEADSQALHVVAERVRAAVEATAPAPGGKQVTVSIGGAIYPLDGSSVEALFQAADSRLYQAKGEGRNRVVVTTARAVQSAG